MILLAAIALTICGLFLVILDIHVNSSTETPFDCFPDNGHVESDSSLNDYICSFGEKISGTMQVEFAGVKLVAFAVKPSILTEAATVQERLLPFDDYRKHLGSRHVLNLVFEPVHLDDKTFELMSLCAKPDAVFKSKDGKAFLVVELKSKELSIENVRGEYAFRKSISRDILQLVISTLVFSDCSNVSANAVLRYRDCVILVQADTVVMEKIRFYRGVLLAMKSRRGENRPTISATELARFMTVLDTEFEANKEDAYALSSVKGELIHLMAIHGRNELAVVNAIANGSSKFESYSFA